MSTQKQFKGAAIAVMVLGIIHTAATPLVLTPLRVLPKPDFMTFAYMFVITGLAVFLCGLLQFIIVKQTEINQLSYSLLKFIVIFMVLIGFGAVAAMWDSFNPFAYIMLLIAVFEVYLLRRLKKEVNF